MASINNDDPMVDVQLHTASINVLEPSITEKNDYLNIKIENHTTSLLNADKPMIPMITKTFVFSAGTKIVDIEVTSNVKEYRLQKKIEPSPKPIPFTTELITDSSTLVIPDDSVYTSKNFYPLEPYAIKKGVGLKDNERMVYVTIYYYCQYSPTTNVIFIPTTIHINVEYIAPQLCLFSENVADLLIITDEQFVSPLQPLVDHKNNMGVITILETVKNIIPQYNGRDEAEDIKLRIKEAVEDWNIKYVLLVGGHKGQTHDWYVPVRYSHNFDGAYLKRGVPYDPKYVSDLYYADVFKYDKSGTPRFEDWDFNANGIFGEFGTNPNTGLPISNFDLIDFYPDVYVGRIPVRYSWEVPIIVDKIITYEKTAAESWFKRGVVVGGDTSPPARDTQNIVENGIYEGELSTGVSARYLEEGGFEVERLYTSTGSFSSMDDVINAVNQGCGFVHFAGHGSPSVWGNFWPDAQTESEFTYGFTILDIRKFINFDQLPIILIGGCHNAQFNVTMQNIIDHGGFSYDRSAFDEHIPDDGASWFLLQRGGSIASIGNTGLGYGYINEYCTEGLGGWINPRFFHAYIKQNKNILGEAHGQTLTDYINQKGSLINDMNSDSIDRKHIEEWVLLGDPSLKIGGYEPDILEREDNKNDHNNAEYISIGTSAGEYIPIWEEGMIWTYKLNTVNLNLSEVEGREMNIHLSMGDIQFSVTEVTSEQYRTTFTTNNLDILADIDFDFYLEDKNPIKITLELLDAKLSGEIHFDKSTMGITSVLGTISGEMDKQSLLENFNMELPAIILRFIPSIPITLKLQMDFDVPYPLIQYPLHEGIEWILPQVTINIDGTVESKYFRLINILNNIADKIGKAFIPPELAKHLPVIDISEILEDFNIPSENDIPEVTNIFREKPFICSGQQVITVDGGTFNTYYITIVHSAAEMYYSPEVENVVKIQGNFNDFIPIIDDITLELIKFEQ